MTDSEKLLIESMKSMLDTKIQLGLKPDEKAENDNNPKMRDVGYLHGHINEMFSNKAANLVHHTGVCAAFSKIHSYKYLDDETFTEALSRELTAQGIPASERKKALEIIPEIIKEVSEDTDEWAEADFGFNPNLQDIMRIPHQFEDEEENA